MKIDGSIAFTNTLRNRFRKFPNREDNRFEGNLILPTVDPSFEIKADSSVFTIGSCFAREVEDALIELGVDVPTAHFSAAQDAVPGRPNRILNQYNPGTMLQCIQSLGKPIDEAGIYPVGDGMVLDCLLSIGSHSVTYARAIERRQQISDLYRRGLEVAHTVVITLGLIEAWYDTKDGIYLNEAPPRAVIKLHEGRFEMRRLSIEDCHALVAEMITRLKEGAEKNILLTVSPVPLQVTFCGGDAVVANSLSKATLRVVANDICSTFQNVDYFPSYEIVTVAGLPAFGDDNVHVRRNVVRKIMSHMMGVYTGGYLPLQK